ncbi:MAG: putative lipid II flippase FtsW [bacterium]
MRSTSSRDNRGIRKSGAGSVHFGGGGEVSAGRPDYAIWLMAFLLTCIGIIMVFSASGNFSYRRLADSTYFLKREVLWTLIALFVMAVAAVCDYRYYRKIAWLLLATSFVMLILVFVPKIGVEIKGARRWLHLGFLDVHTGEVAKLALVIFFAVYLSEIKEKIRQWKYFLIGVGVLALFGLVILSQPDFGMMMLLFAIVMTMMLVAGARLLHLGTLFLGLIPLAIIAIHKAPYRMHRILGFVNPDADPQGSGFQILQSQIAIVSGGLFGQGLGMSRQKRFFLPEQYTDFIFSVFVEESGFIGMIFLIAVFIYLGYRGVNIALKSEDRLGMYLAFGITFSIFFQAFVNMGVAVGLLPITGLTLPFVSFGGSSLTVTYVGIGILLNISVRNNAKRKKRAPDDPAGGGWNGRAHIPSRCGWGAGARTFS